MGPFPGGRLDGEEHPYPSGGWHFAAAEERVAVEVGGEQPRSVHTWAVVLDGALHVPADFFNPGKRWPHLAMDDPRARIRVAGRVYRCRLARIEEPERVEALRVAIAAKYGVEADSWAARVEVWWFRVDPPQPEARSRAPGTPATRAW